MIAGAARVTAVWSAAVWLLSAATAGWLRPSPARAQGLDVPVQVDPCVPIDRDKFVYLLGIELNAESAAERQSERAASVTLSCQDGAIVLTVQDAITRKAVTRLVDLGPVDPSARTRLMALTVAELVLASWLELRLEQRPVIEPLGPRPSELAVARVARVVEPQVHGALPRLRIGASLGAMVFLSAPSPVAGLDVHLTQPLSRRWALQWDVQGGYGELKGSLTSGGRAHSVGVRATTGALRLSLRHTRRLGAFDVWAGLTGVAGFAYLAGAVPPDRMLVSTHAFAPWAGPALQLAAAYRVSEHVRLFLQLEAGVLALGARALGPGQVVAELSGGWLGGCLGFDVGL